ncbi:MAG: GYD domain-containing protein [Candidatus Marinimicrobia bacterium]|jgi:uncharacterized protein with GYD domain|nr:hypothetical protein [Candidatus Neomarinimicrobiota bacterium]MDP7529344.1 GYD domain-containing protein [Candidatus Neomarinimicrobiota bacterium]MDP7653252.1 GYD domain-containing protein [Candidatus Neomarinimicrobiota bacterium]|tara:strand:- start:288 stop:590 length:303 start_codon:yes stop_codon:yes gene_type:complete
MKTFYMFGTYDAEMFRDVSAGRTKEIEAMVKDYGGEIIQIHVLVGRRKDDLVLVVDFPDVETTTRFSIALTNKLGILFVSHPAITMETFDEIAEEVGLVR